VSQPLYTYMYFLEKSQVTVAKVLLRRSIQVLTITALGLTTRFQERSRPKTQNTKP
jgi:hypothetical protein